MLVDCHLVECTCIILYLCGVCVFVCGQEAGWRERERGRANLWGSREPLEIAGRGTDKAARHSSGQMKAVKLTGGTQASPRDGSRQLGGDL